MKPSISTFIRSGHPQNVDLEVDLMLVKTKVNSATTRSPIFRDPTSSANRQDSR